MSDSMRKILGNMDGLFEGAVPVPVVDLEEMAMGQKSFDKLVDTMFLSSKWDRAMDALDKNGFDEIEVQNTLRDFFIIIMKVYFANVGIGTATVRPYQYFALLPSKGASEQSKVEAPDYAAMMGHEMWMKLFGELFASRAFADILYRYGQDPSNPDSTLDRGMAEKYLGNRMYNVVKSYFGRGGKLDVRYAFA
jgi:hypothetical protein